MEGNLRLKIDCASLIVGRKFNVFALFYFLFEGNFRVQAPGALRVWGVYIWRDLFSDFFGTKRLENVKCKVNTNSLEMVFAIT